MRSVNKVILVGNVGQDPKSGVTKAGHTWANVVVATQKMKKDQTQATTWHKIVGFGKCADEIAACKKGDVVFVEGELENNSYVDKNNVKQNTIQVVAQTVMRGAMRSEAAETDGFTSNEYPEQGGF
jgi:single-strand DNA-binding protein